MKRCYVAGAMTNHYLFQFEAFDRARDALLALGWDVVSPADLDRADGYDPLKNPDAEPLDYEVCMGRDERAIRTCTDMCFLPGWEVSSGAIREKEIAEEIDLEMHRVIWNKTELSLYPMKPSVEQEIEAKLDNPQESILMTAENLVNGARRKDYGHPYDDYEAVGRIWGAILTRWLGRFVPTVPPRISCLMMQGVKVSREAHEPKRDNRVDGAGYWGCLDLIAQKGDAPRGDKCETS